MKYSTFLILCCSTLLSCAFVSENRTFIDEMDFQGDPLFVAGRDFNAVSGDSGDPYRTDDEIRRRTPFSAKTREALIEERSIERELRRKEQRLSPFEKEEYYEIADRLGSSSEKIYYLGLSTGERRDYLEGRGLSSRRRASPQSFESRGRSIASVRPISNEYESRNLYLGMTKSDVRGRWGEPYRVEVAGDPGHENERWAFEENGDVRYVFFESGTVHGWQMN